MKRVLCNLFQGERASVGQGSKGGASRLPVPGEEPLPVRTVVLDPPLKLQSYYSVPMYYLVTS